jgi:hypothetical protein
LSFSVPPLFTQVNISRFTSSKRRAVMSCEERPAWIRLDPNVESGLWSREAELPMNCFQEPDGFLVILASPESLIRVTIDAFVVSRVQLLVKVSNRSIGEFPPLH